MPYFYCCAETPLYPALAWGSLFILVNLYQIVMLILERRPVFMGDEELELYRSVFSTLQPREYLRLLSLAEWKRAALGDELLAQEATVTHLLLVSSGCGHVTMDGRHVAEIGPGQFIGEMGFLTGEEASARVVAAMPTDYLSWPIAELQNMLNATPMLHLKFQGVLGSDVVAKLRHRTFAAAHPSQVFTPVRLEDEPK
jgi:CRP-like cAMP-binding protein